MEDEAACHECVCGCGRCVVAPVCVCVWVSSDLHRLEEVGGHGRGEEAVRQSRLLRRLLCRLYKISTVSQIWYFLG